MNTLTLKDIPRVKAGTAAPRAHEATEFNQERAYLAQRAADVLGYNALKADVTGQRIVTAASGPLTEALLKAEVTVLDTATVIDYQLEELNRHNREAIIERFRDYTIGYMSLASWTHTSIKDYDHPIPEFVIDKAIRIKEVCPEAEFVVQHLTLPKADPFLIAHCGKEIYFVEAWDEPRFEAGL